MYLDREQERALAGELGPTKRWAMEALCRLGGLHHAARLVPVRSAHIPDWCARTISDLWPDAPAIEPIVAYTTVNPGGTGDGQASNKRALERLGVRISYTCTPYLVGNHPGRGEVVAWGGGAAASFVNSIMGARSETETFESALASAITGLTPERGLHLDENRGATLAVVVPDQPGIDLTALGFELSLRLRNEVPLICGIRPTFDQAKRLAFALNSRGTVPLFRMQGKAEPPQGLEMLEIGEKASEATPVRDIGPDLIIVGCPHMSEQDINRWSKAISGRRSSGVEVWFLASRLCMDKCPVFGAVLRSRGRVMVDLCPLGLIDQMAEKRIACDSPALAECLRKNGLSAEYLPEVSLRELMVR